jgi:hypothetical protein
LKLFPQIVQMQGSGCAAIAGALDSSDIEISDGQIAEIAPFSSALF